MTGQLESVESSSQTPARRRWQAAAAFLAGVVLVLPVQLLAWLAVSLVLDLPEGSDSEVLFASLWLLIVVVPLVLVWHGGGRLRRWGVAGAAVTMVVLVADLVITAGQPVTDPTAARRLSAMAADSQVPIYYVGPRFHGWTLDEVSIDHGDDQGTDDSDRSLDPGDSLFLGYGTTCTTSTNGTCGVRYELDLHATTSADLKHRCIHKLPTIRGVTPVELEDYGVVIFVGALAIRFPDQPPDALVTDTARALRRVGSTSTADDLPAPSSQATQLTAHCFVRPRG
jgi:hypothetical protein